MRPMTGHAGYAYLEGVAGLIAGAGETAWQWLLKHHQGFVVGRARRELHALSDRTLRDIGVSRSDIESLFR